MLVSSFNLSQSFNYTPYLLYKKRFKPDINSFCIWIQAVIFLLPSLNMIASVPLCSHKQTFHLVLI